MTRLAAIYRSTLGKKVIVAVTGIILLGFVLGHMLGNLKVFTGSDAEGVPHIDIYGHFLRTMGEPVVPAGVLLWLVRIALLVAFVLHVVNVIQLALRNKAARPQRYHHRPAYRQASWAARTMMVGGLILLLFVIVHLLQFTTGTIQVTPVVHGEVYANIYHAFSKWFFVVFYVFAMLLLGLHIYHGAWSMFQTLGLDNPDRNRMLRGLAAALAVVIVAGFCAVPILLFLGVLAEPPVTTGTLAEVGGD